MNEQEKALAKEVGKEACREFLLTCGVDVSSPKEIKEVQKDFAHLRDSRLVRKNMVSTARTKVVGKFVDLGIMGFLLAIYDYIKTGGS